MANTVFNETQNTLISCREENVAQDQDHHHPFHGYKHLNPIGINEDPVRLSTRTKHDFEHTEKLEDPGKKPRPTRTGYESYVRSQATTTRTKSMFANDPERQRIVKHPCDLQRTNYKDLMRVNPEIKAYLDKKMTLEDKKLHYAKYSRLTMDADVKRTQDKIERTFMKRQKRVILETWAWKPRQL